MVVSQLNSSSVSASQSECERAESLLRKAKVRVTDARTRVLSTLLISQRALSHLEVQEALKNIDRVTLYRALDCLTDAGLAHKITGDDRIFRYSTGSEKFVSGMESGFEHQHAHFKCTRCNKLFCLNDEQQASSLKEQLTFTLQTTMPRGFQSHDIELTIKGWCISCST